MRFDSLPAWLDWQAGLNPASIELGLERVDQVWRDLATPAFECPIVTVAGTNGKGSSVAFAEAILQAAGYRTGCYSSPHLIEYNERIRIDQTPVDDGAICAAFDAVDRARGNVLLTYFEFGTLAAFWLFAQQRLDALVLEVGLGGRLDAVNLLDPDVALITSIGLDHQAWLGDDCEQIGWEKAGILRAGRPAVFSGRDMPDSIAARATELNADLRVAGKDYVISRRQESWDLQCGGVPRRALPFPTMRGSRQIDNAAGVLVALDFLADRLPLDQRAIRSGLLAAQLPGRFDVRPGQPTWVLDVAHNTQAAEVLNDLLGDFFVPAQRVAVFGALYDKDVAGIVRVLRGRFDAWYLVDLSAQPRGLSADALAAQVSAELGDVPLVKGGPVEETLVQVVSQSAADDVIVVFGSFLTVGAAMTWLSDTQRDHPDR